MPCGPGNTSFPIVPPAAIDQTLYDSVRDTVPIQFLFGPRANAPIFSQTATASLDEGSGTNPPTVRWAGTTYTLVQAQLTRPLNKSWFLSSVKKDKNVADLTLVLQSAGARPDPKYIFVSIPILRETATVIDPLYLAALAGQLVNGPFSLSQCIPSAADYASYSTCLEPNPFNAFCIVFYQGLSVNGATLDALATAAGNGGSWPSFKAPTDVTLVTTTLTLTPAAFRAAVRVSTLGAAQTVGSLGGATRVDNTSAYQCVPLDPDRDIANGKLTIDTSTGIPQPMNKLLGARDSMRANAGGKPPLAPGEIETVIAVFLGIILSLALIIGAVYAYFYYKTGSLAILDTWPAWVREFPWLVFTAVLFSFAGFLIGAFTR